MSIQAVAWALEQDLPAHPKLVLVAIANHANHTDGYCWLKAETIAKEAACKPRSVWRFIGALVRNGYIRKAPKRGADGKQRANDYWILFGREMVPWDWGKELDGAIDSMPDDLQAHGENIEPHDSDDIREITETQSESLGPCAIGVTHIESLKPSKTNPKKDARASEFTKPPRGYQPPPIAPPEPQGAVIADKDAKLIFVFERFDREPNPAFEAHCLVKSHEKRLTWRLTCRQLVDGKWRSGWFFPTLWPPPDKLAAAERYFNRPPRGPPIEGAEFADEFDPSETEPEPVEVE